jgi:hypothetical protein
LGARAAPVSRGNLQHLAQEPWSAEAMLQLSKAGAALPHSKCPYLACYGGRGQHWLHRGDQQGDYAGMFYFLSTNQ